MAPSVIPKSQKELSKGKEEILARGNIISRKNIVVR